MVFYLFIFLRKLQKKGTDKKKKTVFLISLGVNSSFPANFGRLRDFEVNNDFL